MTLMENFRDFQAGPDPFGRTWHVMFKYLQTAISIRHSDSVDVCFILEPIELRIPGSDGTDNDPSDGPMKKIVVIPHAAIRAYAERMGRKISDTWCSRVAVCKLRHVIDTAEDLEKEYLYVTPKEIEEYDSAILKWEDEWVRKHAA